MNEVKIKTINTINYSVGYLNSVKNILTSLDNPATELMWAISGMLGMLTGMLIKNIDDVLKNPETLEDSSPIDDISKIQLQFNNALDDIKASLERKSAD